MNCLSKAFISKKFRLHLILEFLWEYMPLNPKFLLISKTKFGST
jgi:hypothetical protein